MFRFLISKQSAVAFGVFGGGQLSGGSSTNASQKYNFSTAAVASGTNLGTARNALASCGTSGTGYFSGGRDATNYSITTKYSFSDDNVSSGSSITGGSRWGLAACGNSTVGIFGSGYSVTNTCKYTYSGDTVAAGTAMYEGWGIGAGGNSSDGIFAAGWTNTLSTYLKKSNKYTYSSDSVSSGTDITTAVFGLFGAGDSTTAYLFGGAKTGDVSITNTDKYTISAGTVAAGGVLAQGRHSAAASATAGKIIVACGAYYTGPSAETRIASSELYSIASDSFSSSTSFTTAKMWLAAVSTSPAHI